MKNNGNKTYLMGSRLIGLASVLAICLLGCVEEFSAETQRLENLLVVDALLTDGTKCHKVILKRLFPFEEEEPQPEVGARVIMSASQGMDFTFEETEPGVYFSGSEFAAQQGQSYTLRIETKDGRNYASETEQLPPKTPINAMRAERMVNDLGDEGVGIMLDNISEPGSPNFFRYEYEETYKIIAPKWDPFDFEVVYYVPCTSRPYQVDIITNTGERRVCYASATSNQIIQASTADLIGNSVENKQIRFLSRDNYIISHRYSILVRQYTQTQDAHSFYQRLEDFSSSENLFSQIQPGFLEGNINSETNAEEGVLGYFEVASVTEERMYFNYEDLFPGEDLPPYIINCFMGNPPLYSMGYHCDGDVCDGDCESPLIEAILAGLISFAAENDGNFNRPYFTWPRACGDCTKLGSNVVPDFWEE